MLSLQFVRLGHHSIGSIHLTVYAKRGLAPRVKLVKMSDVACGVGNVLQNKGAVAAFLRYMLLVHSCMAMARLLIHKHACLC